MEKRQIGSFSLISLDDGIFRLDGGSMYGVVPRVLWSRVTPPDPLNRIAMRARPLLVQGPSGTCLVEAGLGDAGDAAFQQRYGVELPRGLIQELARAGVVPEEIDCVVMTHLHWDHAGGLVHRDEMGKVVPTFPDARHFVQEAAWQEALASGPRAGSFHPDRLEPLEKENRLELVRGETEVLPGLSLVPAGGHSEGHSVVRMTSEGETALFLGDLVPMRSHFKTPWIMAFDLQPGKTAEAKEALLARACEENWLLVLYHDADVAFGTLVQDDGGGFVLDPTRPDPGDGPDPGQVRPARRH